MYLTRVSVCCALVFSACQGDAPDAPENPPVSADAVVAAAPHVPPTPPRLDAALSMDMSATDRSGTLDAADGADGPAAYRVCATTPKFTPEGELLPLRVDATRALRIGAGSSLRDPFPGDMDRVRLMNRVITPEEVAAHFELRYEPCADATGCVLEWTFDALEAGRFSGLPSPAQVIGQVATVEGRDGKAAHFDGSGAVESAHQPALTFTRSFSYEAWVRRGACPPTFTGKCNMMRLFEKGDNLRLDAHAGGLRFSTTSGIYHSVPWPSEDKWTHLAISYDVRDGVRFYRNGKLQKHCPLR